jgi:hypothetical protein
METLGRWKLRESETLWGSTICSAENLGGLKLSRDIASVKLETLSRCKLMNCNVRENWGWKVWAV